MDLPVERYGRVLHRSHQQVLASRVTIARSFAQRFLGLMGRKTVPDQEGYFFPRCNSIHTWFMRCPIDVAIVDVEGRVLQLFTPLLPWRLVPPVPRAWGVLELAAGALSQAGVQQGDTLNVLPP